MLTSATTSLFGAKSSEELGGLKKLDDCCSMLGRRGLGCASGSSQNGSFLALFLSSSGTKYDFCSSGGMPRRQRDGLDLSSFLVERLPGPRPVLSTVFGVDDEIEADVGGFRTPIGDGSGGPFGDGLTSTSEEAGGGWIPRSNTSCDDGSLLPR